MGRKARSARGVIVDFDLMKIKEQIANTPTPMEVKTRQNFIEHRLKRRIKKAELPKIESTDIEAKVELPEPKKAVNVKHIEDNVDELTAGTETPEEDVEAPAPVKKTTKQIARPNKKKKNT